MNVELKTERYFTCPNGCAHRFRVEHLFEDGLRRAGPWYCRECGQGWDMAVSDDGAVDVTKHEPKADNCYGHDGRQYKQTVILEIPPQTEPIRFVVQALRARPNIDEDEDATRYYYEEHTCMPNWLPDVRELLIGSDEDPHGLANVVEIRDGWKADWR